MRCHESLALKEDKSIHWSIKRPFMLLVALLSSSCSFNYQTRTLSWPPKAAITGSVSILNIRSRPLSVSEASSRILTCAWSSIFESTESFGTCSIPLEFSFGRVWKDLHSLTNIPTPEGFDLFDELSSIAAESDCLWRFWATVALGVLYLLRGTYFP